MNATRSYSSLAVVGALCLCVLQIATGTDVYFALLVLAFHSLALLCVNLLGGLRDLMGIAVAWLALQSVTISQVAKVIKMQAAEAPLLSPHLTMSVLCAGMLSLAFGALMLRAIRGSGTVPASPWPNDAAFLAKVSWICLFVNVVRLVFLVQFGYDSTTGLPREGAFVGTIRGADYIGYLGVAAGTASVLLRTMRLSCLSLPAVLGALVFLGYGILTAGREDSVSGGVILVVTALAYGYRPSLATVIGSILAVLFAVRVVFPYAVYARHQGVRTESSEQNIERSIGVFLDVIANPDKYEERNLAVSRRADPVVDPIFQYYYPERLPVLARYSIIPTIDRVVHATARGEEWGMKSISPGFFGMLPRVVRPANVDAKYTNVAAWRIPELQGRSSAKLTIGFIPDAYSAYGFVGALLIPMAILFTVGSLLSVLFGTTLSEGVIPCGLVLQVSWPFSEQTISAQVQGVFPGVLVLFAFVWLMLLFRRWGTRQLSDVRC